MPGIVSPQQFEQLYKSYFLRLYHYAYGFIEDAGASEDIVSEVFAVLWREQASLAADTTTAYLFTSVRNRCLNYLRNQRGHAERLAYLRASLTEEDEQSWLTLEERIAELRAEIDKLPSKTRFVLEQCYLEGHTYREVGDMLGITSDGVKKHVVKAFALLRGHFHVKKK